MASNDETPELEDKNAAKQGSSAQDKPRDDLKKVRATIKGKLTKATSLLRVFISEEDARLIKESLKEMKGLLRQVNAIHDDYAGSDPSEDDYAYITEINERYAAAVKDANSTLRESDNQKPADPTETTAIMNCVNLPRMEIQPFHGDPAEYQLFIRTFDELVDSMPIDDGKKLSRLLQFTKGRAFDSIRSYSFADNGYLEARKTLKERFGDKHIITDFLTQSLRNGQKTQNAQDITQLADDLRACAATLKELKTLTEVESQNFIVCVARRLPNHSLQRWKQQAMDTKRDSDNYPDFKSFTEFVAKEAQNESDPIYGQVGIDGEKGTSTNVRTSYASDASGASVNRRPEPRCYLCSGPHKLARCDNFKGMSPQDRLTFIDSKNLCHICFFQ